MWHPLAGGPLHGLPVCVLRVTSGLCTGPSCTSERVRMSHPQAMVLCPHQLVQVVGSSCALAGGVQLGGEGHIGRGQDAVFWAFENFARRMVHLFPTNPTARACLGLMLRRRACGDGTRPLPQVQRRQLERLMRGCMESDHMGRSDSATGWKALAELQYENRDYAAAHDTACRGLAWLHDRRERGHEALTQCALALRLVVAKALRRMGKLDEAESHFKVLAGWVTEGECAFAEMSGSAPVSIHQQALRGLALVVLQRGDRQSAKAQYERILGAAALGRGAAEHWAHADYGWLLFEDGDLHGAREHLEQVRWGCRLSLCCCLVPGPPHASTCVCRSACRWEGSREGFGRACSVTRTCPVRSCSCLVGVGGDFWHVL